MLRWLGLVVGGAVGLALVLFGGGTPTVWRAMAALGLVGLTVAAARRPHELLPLWAAALLGVGLWYAALPPSHDRDWVAAQSRLPRVQVDEQGFRVADQRAFRWTGPDKAEPAWVTASYRFDDIVGADLGLSRFSELEAMAHTFVSVRFRDGRVLVVSVEVRKEQGESFSPIRGVLRHYEKLVVLGDELDLIGLRAIHLQERVELHPLQVSNEQIEQFLRAVLAEAQAIEAQPVWYHTVMASCSTSLSRHLRAMGALPVDPRVMLPGYADALAHDLGWLGDEPLEVLREAHRVDPRARAWDGEGSLSEALRRP